MINAWLLINDWWLMIDDWWLMLIDDWSLMTKAGLLVIDY
jgi:hypothetical protein